MRQQPPEVRCWILTNSWRGWLGYTDWRESRKSTAIRDFWHFEVDCGEPEDTGIYNYRFNTRGVAQDGDGTIITGSPVWGGQGRYGCGGGNGS